MTIRDANGVFVAVPTNGPALREINGQAYSIWSLSSAGLGQTDLTQFHFYHMVPNCADSRLLSGFNNTLYIVGTTGYYTPTPITEAAVSIESFTAGQDLTQPGQCTNAVQPFIPLGPVRTVDVSSWGLTPPFSWHLE